MLMQRIVLLLLVTLLFVGCIHSYSKLEFDSITDNAKSKLQWGKASLFSERNILYSQEFSYFPHHGEYDNFFKELFVRLPTMLSIELPFYFLNRKHLYLPIPFDEEGKKEVLQHSICVDDLFIKFTYKNRDDNIFVLEKDPEGRPIKYLLIEKEEDRDAYISWVYVCNDKKYKTLICFDDRDIRLYITKNDICYMVRGNKNKLFSFFGFTIGEKYLKPVAWRIDLKTGEKKCILYLDHRNLVIPKCE